MKVHFVGYLQVFGSWWTSSEWQIPRIMGKLRWINCVSCKIT